MVAQARVGQNSVYRMQLSLLPEQKILRRDLRFLSSLFFAVDRPLTQRGIYFGAKWRKVVESRKTFFMGQYEHGLDGKNRLFLPSRFREKSRGTDFVLTQGLERCLFLFPLESWNELAGKLADLPIANKVEERAFKRILLSAACEAEVDGQGRILIPQNLKEYAQITHDVVVLGVLKHVEIWAKEEWDHYRKKARASFEKVAPHLDL